MTQSGAKCHQAWFAVVNGAIGGAPLGRGFAVDVARRGFNLFLVDDEEFGQELQQLARDAGKKWL